MGVFGKDMRHILIFLILNIIQRHNFFQSFASIGRVDLVLVKFGESDYLWIIINL